MTIRSTSQTVATSASRLLLENVNFGFRTSIRPTRSPSAQLPAQPSAVGRIEQLVSSIQSEFLDGISSGSQASQQTINRALAEIGKLVGTPLTLGGKNNAVLQGLNSNQITGYEIRTLRPNTSANISGSISQSQQPAQADLGNIQELLTNGGSLEFHASGRNRSIQVNRGESINSLVHRINRNTSLGVTAQASNSSLILSSQARGTGISLSVVSRQQGTSESIGPIQISGVNASQITSLDTSGLTAGVPLTVTGSRDSLTSAAELTYEGSSGAVASGSATFQLTGPLGSANLTVVQGESLLDFASRINAETGTTGVEAEVEGNNIAIRSLEKGASASLSIGSVDPESEITVTGTNASQVAALDVLSFPDETQLVLSGTVTQAADLARQTYHGTTGGFVADTAVFTLGGSTGTAQIAITQGESLADVAQRVNDETATTGVTASTSGDDLILESENLGSSETVQVTLDSITQYLSVDGVNASQISDFQVVSAEPDSVNNLAGSVTQAATQGELTYTGTLGSATSSANITLTGELGSATISVFALESLSSVRDKINAESANTGISATASGNVLTLTSDDYGSAAIVEVDVNSGTFTTIGGDGFGNAAGLDVELDINGNTVTGNRHDVSYVDSLGSYTFTVEQGFSGTFDTITVTSANGAFDVSGGDVNGDAFGLDAEATINSQAFVGEANDFSLDISGAQFDLTIVDGFSGALDPITVESEFHDFTITGGNGDSTADGLDGTATINGESLSSADDTFVAATAAGTLTLEFEASFVGAIDAISIDYEIETASQSSSNSFHANGSDAEVLLNGKSTDGSNGEFVYRSNGVEIALQFAKGFQGSFDSFTIAAGKAIDVATEHAPLSGSLRASARSAVQRLFTLATGGENAEAGSSRSLTLALDALQSSRSIQGISTSASRRSLTGEFLDTFG